MSVNALLTHPVCLELFLFSLHYRQMKLQTISWTLQIDYYLLTGKFWKNPMSTVIPPQHF